ncbi:hypothetical protein H4V98_000622 [Polaromonas sp. CG_23.6]|nr:hypothetical protein [Polaromonas sp. CG_23.6]
MTRHTSDCAACACQAAAALLPDDKLASATIVPYPKATSPHQKSSHTMTEDLNRKNELKKMALCESCAGIQRNWRKAPGHPELVQGGNRQEKRGASLVTLTSYRCDRCGTAWEYENNRANQQAGWSVVGR